MALFYSRPIHFTWYLRPDGPAYLIYIPSPFMQKYSLIRFDAAASKLWNSWYPNSTLMIWQKKLGVS